MDATTPEEFMRAVRTRACTIIGFGELLTLAELRLPAGRRREYARIMSDETRALEQDIVAFFHAPSPRGGGAAGQGLDG